MAAALVVVLAAALRLCELGRESLWIDEGYSLRDASGAYALTDIRPLYFRILHLWMHFGHSEAWLRLPSVIFGVTAVILLYVLARRLFGRRVAVVSAFLLAVSPLHVNHSQEVRMYSLATMLVIAEVLFFVRYLDRSRAMDLVTFLIVAGSAFLVFPLTVFMLVALNLFFLTRVRDHRGQSAVWYGSQVAVGLTALPLLPSLAGAVREYSDAWTWRLPKPGVPDMLWATRDFFLWRVPADHKRAVLAGGVFACAVLCLAAYGAARASRKARWQTALVVLWFAVPIVATVAVSHTVANIWLVRYMIYASPAYFILTALGLSSVRNRWAFGLLAVGIVLLPAFRLYSYYSKPHRPEWRQAVEYVQSQLRPGDAIVLYRYGNRYVFDYYYSGQADRIALGSDVLGRKDFDGWTDRRIEDMMSAIPPDARRIWFVFSYHEDTGGFSLEDYVRRRYRVLRTRDFVRIDTYLAAPKATATDAGS